MHKALWNQRAVQVSIIIIIIIIVIMMMIIIIIIIIRRKRKKSRNEKGEKSVRGKRQFSLLQ